MNSSYFGFNSFYNGLNLQPYDQERFSLLSDKPYLYAMMMARYVICSREKNPPDPRAKLLFQTEDNRRFENPPKIPQLLIRFTCNCRYLHRHHSEIDNA